MTISAVMLVPQFLDLGGRALDLLGGRHQRRAILQRPAVILHVRDLDAAGAELEREIDHVARCARCWRDAPPALTVSGIPSRTAFGRERVLALKRAAIAGDMVGGRRFGVLDRNLHVVEAGLRTVAQGRRGDADAGGDEIGVEAGLVRGGRRCRRDRAARRARRRRDAPAARRAPAASLNTRDQVAVSSSSSRGSSASGLEQ